MNKKILFLSLSALSIADIYTMDMPRKRKLSTPPASPSQPSYEGYNTDPDIPSVTSPVASPSKAKKVIQRATIESILNESSSTVLCTYYQDDALKQLMLTPANPVQEDEDVHADWLGTIVLDEKHPLTFSYNNKVYFLKYSEAEKALLVNQFIRAGQEQLLKKIPYGDRVVLKTFPYIKVRLTNNFPDSITLK